MYKLLLEELPVNVSHLSGNYGLWWVHDKKASITLLPSGHMPLMSRSVKIMTVKLLINFTHLRLPSWTIQGCVNPSTVMIYHST